MNMKQRQKLIVLIILTILCIPSFAQMEVSKPDRFLPKIGVKAGLTLSNFLDEEDDYSNSTNYNMRVGFHAGIFVEIPISNRFAFEPGILFLTKGYYYSDSWTDSIEQEHEYYEEKYLYYLDIPLPFKASLEFGGIKIFGTAGPYLGIGIGGKIYDYDKIDGVKDESEEKVSWGSTEGKDHLKPFDYGLTFGAGVEFKSFQLSFAYDLGLANISVYTEEGYKINNRVMLVSLAYKFGKIE